LSAEFRSLVTATIETHTGAFTVEQLRKTAIACAVGRQTVWQMLQAKADQAQAAADKAKEAFCSGVIAAANAHPEECGHGWLQYHIANTLDVDADSRAQFNRLGLHVYLIRESLCKTTTRIVAASESRAWGKFVTQYFGALKPCRDDYSIEEQS
jgi:hypothetical protein